MLKYWKIIVPACVAIFVIPRFLNDGVETYKWNDDCYTVDYNVGGKLNHSQRRRGIFGPTSNVHFQPEITSEDKIKPIGFSVKNIGPTTNVYLSTANKSHLFELFDPVACNATLLGDGFYSVAARSEFRCAGVNSFSNEVTYIGHKPSESLFSITCNRDNETYCGGDLYFRDVEIHVSLWEKNPSEWRDIQEYIRNILDQQFKFYPKCEGA